MKKITHAIFSVLLLNCSLSAAMHNPKQNYSQLCLAAEAGNLAQVQELIQEGVPVNYHDPKDKNCRQALNCAAAWGHVDVMQFLLDSNADIERKSGWVQNAPIHSAVDSHNRRNAIDCLMRAKANIDAHDCRGETALFACIQAQDVTVTQDLIEQYGAQVNKANIYGSSPLHTAVRQNHDELYTLLVQAKANVNLPDKEGNTPLHVAADHPDGKAYLFLIGAGADEQARNVQGVTPLEIKQAHKQRYINEMLCYAARRGDLAMTQEMVKEGAVINIPPRYRDCLGDCHWRGSFGDQPLYKAASCGKLPIVQYLLEMKSGVDVQDGECGNRPLSGAALYNHPEVIDCLLQAGAEINAQNREENTALYEASLHGSVAAVTRLLTRKADPNIPNTETDTPLIAACTGNQISKTIVGLLLFCKANPNGQDGLGYTALHRAAQNNNFDACRLLVQAKALVDVQDEYHLKPIQWATHDNVKQFLANAAAEQKANEQKDQS